MGGRRKLRRVAAPQEEETAEAGSRGAEGRFYDGSVFRRCSVRRVAGPEPGVAVTVTSLTRRKRTGVLGGREAQAETTPATEEAGYITIRVSLSDYKN